MAYIGREPLGGEVILMNSIESQFDGVETTFNLTRTVSGVTSDFYPISSEQLLVSLGGVIQKPDTSGSIGFKINFNQIVFAVPPSAATSCFIIAYGNLIDIGAPANNTVSTDKLVDGSVTSAKIADGTIVNADVNASAAIDGTKISPNFGSQNVLTTGTSTASSLRESTDGGTTYYNVVTEQDIGLDPNKIPLNQYLGKMAFVDRVGDISTSSTEPINNLDVNFEYVSNTSIKIRMRGSDGVVRSVTLTLA